MTDKMSLAHRIDDFSYDWDPFTYHDEYDEKGDAVEEIAAMLDEDPEGLADIIDDMADEAADYGERADALALAKEVRDYGWYRQAEAYIKAHTTTIR